MQLANCYKNQYNTRLKIEIPLKLKQTHFGVAWRTILCDTKITIALTKIRNKCNYSSAINAISKHVEHVKAPNLV